MGEVRVVKKVLSVYQNAYVIFLTVFLIIGYL